VPPMHWRPVNDVQKRGARAESCNRSLVESPFFCDSRLRRRSRPSADSYHFARLLCACAAFELGWVIADVNSQANHPTPIKLRYLSFMGVGRYLSLS
jgi:hypothetical protein